MAQLRGLMACQEVAEGRRPKPEEALRPKTAALREAPLCLRIRRSEEAAAAARPCTEGAGEASRSLILPKRILLTFPAVAARRPTVQEEAVVPWVLQGEVAPVQEVEAVAGSSFLLVHPGSSWGVACPEAGRPTCCPVRRFRCCKSSFLGEAAATGTTLQVGEGEALLRKHTRVGS